MQRFRAFLITAAVPLACCAPVGPTPPSLLPRPAESIDPRLTVVPATPAQPAGIALLGRLAALQRQAQAGNTQFLGAAGRAEQLAQAAGTARSESWIVAQEAYSAATAARSETTRALGDLDALVADALQGQGTVSPGDLAAVQAAANAIAAIDQAQSARLQAIARRLGS